MEVFEVLYNLKRQKMGYSTEKNGYLNKLIENVFQENFALERKNC